MCPDIFAAVRRRCGRFSLRDPQQQPDQIESGQIGAHRFDQSRIAIDKEATASSGKMISTDNAPCQPSCSPIVARRARTFGRRTLCLIASPPPAPAAICR